MQKFKLNPSLSSHQIESIAPNKIKSVLQQCYLSLSDLKQKNKKLEEQVHQKNTIISKLIEEKQGYLLHLSICQSDTLKREIELAHQKNIDLQKNFEGIIQSFEKTISKLQSDNTKIKGFNSVLRYQNNHLREQVAQSHAKLRHKNIGKITPVKQFKLFQDQRNNYQITRNQKQNNQAFNFCLSQSKTPQKFKSSKSANLSSTTEKSTSRPSSKKSTLKPRHLFENNFLKEQIDAKSVVKKTMIGEDPVSSKQQMVEIWFKKLKGLLANSQDQL